MVIPRTKGQLGAKLSSSIVATTPNSQVFSPSAKFRVPSLQTSLLPVNKVNTNVFLIGLVRISNEIKCGELNLYWIITAITGSFAGLSRVVLWISEHPVVSFNSCTNFSVMILVPGQDSSVGSEIWSYHQLCRSY